MLADANTDVFQLMTFSLIKPQHRPSQHKLLPALSVRHISTELELLICVKYVLNYSVIVGNAEAQLDY